jgi:hypothetical protein
MYPNRWGANQVATINVLGGVLSNSTAVGINLNQSANANNTGTMNLNGGTVQANSVSGANVRLNFNGGTLKARQMFPARLRQTTASSCSARVRPAAHSTLNAGLGTNWFDVRDSTATNSLILPMDLMNGSVFYRLVYP